MIHSSVFGFIIDRNRDLIIFNLEKFFLIKTDITEVVHTYLYII